MNNPILPKFILFLMLSTHVLTSSAVVASKADFNDPTTVAIVNGYRLPVASVDLLYQRVSIGKRPMRYVDLVNGLIENRLLAEYAMDDIGVVSLMSNNPVGFSIDTYLDDQYVGLVQTAFQSGR